MCILKITVTLLILQTANSADKTNLQNASIVEDLSESASDEQSELWNERRSSYDDLPSECREGIHTSIKYNI